jgi:thiol-disulfide isomerase/thioredoxin
MLERILILFVVLALSFLYIKKPRGKISFAGIADKISGTANMNPALPTVLYFWTEQCSQCKTVQAPIINKINKELNNFNILPINAIEEKEITSLLNVKTVPSLAVISSNNELKFFNSGLVTEKELKRQLTKAIA